MAEFYKIVELQKGLDLTLKTVFKDIYRFPEQVTKEEAEAELHNYKALNPNIEYALHTYNPDEDGKMD